jgi:hypothetical protein
MLSAGNPAKWTAGGFWRDGFLSSVRKSARRCIPIATIISGVLGAWCAKAATDNAISYNNQIGPILSEHRFHCHGPDSAARKPKKNPLRLDRPDFAYAARDNGKPVIIKGDPSASELIHRVTATDDDVMPPASEQKPLTTDDIALLKQWIAQGGKYEKQWSLIPPTRPMVPKDGASWAHNPIDNFVARKLAQNGLKPNPEEQRGRLYRRLSFDLTGLPPNPRDLEAFVRSGSDRAYEKAVDRMLASDASAEQFTRHWLDAVRYADSQGIHIDYIHDVWPYRDWVIDAYKTNMPFDQFTIDQVAGDMLPNATDRQKVASGYNRLIESTSEGGAISDEYAAIYAKDRVDTTAAVWLGLTIGCATCHDHKFDPITTKDFYSLTAFFRNNTSPIIEGRDDPAPTMFVPAREDAVQWEKSQKAIAAAKAALTARKSEAKPAFEKWLAHAKSAKSDISISPSLRLPLTESNGVCVGKDLGNMIDWKSPSERKAGPFGPAPLVAGGNVVEKANPVITRRGQASYGLFIYVEKSPSGSVISRMDDDNNYRGWDMFMENGKPIMHVIDQWPDKALKIEAKQPLKPGRWHHLMAVFDGQREGAQAAALYVDGIKAEVDVNNNNLGTNISTGVPLRLAGRTSKGGPAEILSGGKVYMQDVRFYEKALTSEEVAQLAVSRSRTPIFMTATWPVTTSRASSCKWRWQLWKNKRNRCESEAA